jgi:hypothetical protein
VILRHRRKEPTLILEAAKDVTAVADLGGQVGRHLPGRIHLPR